MTHTPTRGCALSAILGWPLEGENEGRRRLRTNGPLAIGFRSGECRDDCCVRTFAHALRVRSCKGLSDACRIQACAAHSVGRRPASLKGGNRGGIRPGGSAGSAYGDLTAAGWLAGIAWSAGSRGPGQPRDRGHGVATAFRWRRRVLPGELGARGGLEPSGAVAGLGGRHAWRFWAG